MKQYQKKINAVQFDGSVSMAKKWGFKEHPYFKGTWLASFNGDSHNVNAGMWLEIENDQLVSVITSSTFDHKYTEVTK